jgi:hypothetical protein
MRPINEASSRILSQNLSRKYIALGRIVSQWTEIMGAEFAEKAQPIKLNYRKNGNGKTPSATLDIATTSANATVLAYQKGVILERINRIFGDQWITDIRFVASTANQDRPEIKKKPPNPLTSEQKKSLSGMLDLIEDQDMKIKLERLGQAIMTEQNS